jgi:RND family efflux transporter MFP subunit
LQVEEGQKVAAGDLLATLDTSGQDDALAAAAATVSAAKSQADSASKAYTFANEQYDNMRTLFAAGAATQAQVDESKLRLDVAKNDLNSARELVRQAEADLAYRQQGVAEVSLTSLKAGYITKVLVQAGEMVAPGTPIAVLKSQESIMKFYVPDSFAATLKIGMPLVIETLANSTDGVAAITATLSKIDDSTDPITRTIAIEASTEATLLAGAPMTASIELEKRLAIWVPIDAILSSEHDYVYLVKDGKATKTAITIVGYHGFEAAITGIREGDIIITGNAGKVKPFEPVSIMEAQEGR